MSILLIKKAPTLETFSSPETATSIAIRLDELGNLDLIAPYGLTDLFDLVVKPTPKFDTIIVEKRLREKKWLTKWRNLKYIKNHI